MRSLRKIRTRLRGTNFCICSARFAPSSVRQPNGPKCTQVVRNAPKRQFRVQCGGTCSARFAPSSVRQPNGPKCTQVVRNAPKCQFRVKWGGLGVFLVKNSDATSWHELLHSFRPFYTKFRKATERSQMHPNSMKRPKTSV